MENSKSHISGTGTYDSYISGMGTCSSSLLVTAEVFLKDRKRLGSVMYAFACGPEGKWVLLTKYI